MTARRAAVVSTLAILALGSVAHFVHGWAGRTWVTALVFPVDESIWEHTRLATWPGLAVLAWHRRQLPRPGLGFAAYAVVAPLLVAVLYYAYTGALGIHGLVYDLLVFVAAVTGGIAAAFHVGRRGEPTRRTELVGWAITAAVALASIVWTFWAPALPLFTPGG